MNIAEEVRDALSDGTPVIALESTIIAHGLPYPDNRTCAEGLEALIRAEGAVPATIAVLDGLPTVGLTPAELERLADPAVPALKLSAHDIPVAMAQRADGATTVAGTLAIAERAGLEFFATGGIGGVHRDLAGTYDISADIRALSNSPLTVASAGAKSILDLPKTLEALESAQVLVVGYQTDVFPAFYTRGSLPLDHRVDSVVDAARLHQARRQFGATSAMLLAIPVPPEVALDLTAEQALIDEALIAASSAGVAGKQLTPFILGHLHAHSGGDTLRTNVQLVRNNTATLARVAVAAQSLQD